MDLIKLLESVDDFIYEIALWVLFVPRTFFKISFRPRWVCTYVEAELQKDKQARFQEYLSPILYWALVGLVPYFFVLGALSSVTESRVASEVGFRRLLALDWQNQFLVVSLFAVGGPLEFSRRTVRAQALVASRELLRKPFSAQCYCFGTAYLLLLPWVTISLRYDDKIPAGFVSVLSIISGLVFCAWLVLAETLLLEELLGIAWLDALGFVLRCAVSAFFIVFGIEILIIFSLYPQLFIN